MSKWNRCVKVNFPFQVDVELESFCEGCTNVDLTASTQRIYSYDKPTEAVINVVTCDNIDRCRRMFEHFKRTTNEIH